MLYGMGTVVLFLAALVIATMAMSAVIGNYFAQPQRVEPVASGGQASTGSARHIDPTTLSVITAAIHQHRKRGR